MPSTLQLSTNMSRSGLILPPSAATASFDPLTYSPLAWYDPSDAATVTLNGSNVSQLNDKSGNGYHLIQATGVRQPLYVSGGMNGRNCLSLDAGDVLSNATLSTVPTTATYYFVGFVTNTTGDRSFVGAGAAGGMQIRVNAATNTITVLKQATASLLTTSAVLAANVQSVVTVTFADSGNGNSVSVRIDDGTPVTSAVGTTLSAAGPTFLFGAQGLVAEAFLGSLAEALYFPTVHDAPTQTLFRAYLKAKWGTV
jgi:hypothetical protein